MNFDLARFSGRVSVLVEADGRQQIILKAAGRVLRLSVRGVSVFEEPLHVRFVMDGLGRKRAMQASRALKDLAAFLSDRPEARAPAPSAAGLRIRNGLIALDGDAAGASYRDIARVIFGAEVADVVWYGRDWTPKDQVRRALARARLLMMGGYRQLLR